MKILILLLFPIFFFVSCDYSDETFVTEVIEIRDLNAQIINVEVPVNSWGVLTPGKYNTFADVFEIDDFIMSNGIVLVYQQSLNGNSYRQLPVTDVIFKDDGFGNIIPYTQRFEYYYSFGQVEFLFYDDRPNPVPPQNFEQFRIVVIDGTVAGESFKNKSYNQLITELEANNSQFSYIDRTVSTK